MTSLCDTYTSGSPINLSHDSSDCVLAVVQAQLSEHLHLVDGRAGLLKAIRQIEACEALGDAVTLDLIAHSSSSDQVLVFDGWKLEAGDDLTRFCDELGPLSRITKLRLLGCGTANSGAGCAAMNLLRDKLGIEVLGTDTLIDASAFTDRQFRGDYLSEQKVCTLPRPFEWNRFKQSGHTPFQHVEKLALTGRAAKARAELLSQLDAVLDWSQAFRAPGLLLEPLESYTVPLGNSGHTIALEVLLQHEYLRVRGPGDDCGVIFRQRKRESVEKVLQRKPTLPYRAPL